MTNIKWVKDFAKLSDPLSEITDWLKPYRLSQALKKICNNLTVQVLYQQLDKPQADEIERLKIKEPEAFIREVILQGDEIPFTFGRVVIPKATYSKYFAEFNGLQNQLIGETLLYQEGVIRSPFEYTYLTSTQPLTVKICQYLSLIHSKPLWGRRSVFSMGMGSFPLLVSEFILPSIPPYPYALFPTD